MRIKLLSLALLASLSVNAEKIDIKTLRHAGPFAVQVPVAIDSTDAKGSAYNAQSMLDQPMAQLLKSGSEVAVGAVALPSEGNALNVYGFSLQNTRYATVKLLVEGVEKCKVFVDGKASSGSVKLEPGTHQVLIQCLNQAGHAENLKVTVDDPQGLVAQADNQGRMYGLKDVLLGERCSGVSLSADGRYSIISYTTTLEGGKSSRRSVVTELATGRQQTTTERIQWMPRSNRYYFQRNSLDGQQLVVVDPATGAQDILADHIPSGRFQIAPSEDYLLYSTYEEGPKERKEIYQVLTPDDRQPGWRNRSNLAKYDLKTGIMQPLTFGHHNIYCSDISQDGTQLLVMKSEARLTQRPTTLSTLYLMDVNTLQMTPLVEKDGFLSGATFSPDGKQVLLTGSPEALKGIGLNVKPDQIPNQYDYQLYMMDLANRNVRPLTKDFNPAVSNVEWSTADGMIYFTAENRDYVSLYRLNPTNGKIQQIEVPEDMVSGFSLAQNAPCAVWYGQGASNSDRVYTLDLKKLKSTLTDDISARTLKDVELGECHAWNFTNSRGDTIYGRFYLPPHFDPNKKYPMIVNYYGGCSPTSRNFESRYPHHAYAALGYVVYVVEPSGATGFGQEFSARHVNTAGEGPAQDIIEGTQQFCKEHAFVNEKKIGCIGASYGGFMTQYLQTKTDIFAAAISHAGISDHTSYWGEGYWGYSYSEVSMANSYPWTRKDLYVDRSPLFNADKIHTPLLFVHGDADTNVPVGESIQMFTALKLLGRETAFVAVTGQDHHILDYDKRIMWQNTIWAWFAKWLQDDPTWWDTIYTPKDL